MKILLLCLAVAVVLLGTALFSSWMTYRARKKIIADAAAATAVGASRPLPVAKSGGVTKFFYRDHLTTPCSRNFKNIAITRCKADDIEDRYGIILPSFVSGLGATLDLGATGATGLVYNLDEDPWSQDREALSSDWRVVGETLRCAASRFRK
jgi:hypothetical protein